MAGKSHELGLVGKVFDAGHAWAEIRSVFLDGYLGVEIHPEGSRVLLPDECRRLATFLILAADYCEKKNQKRRVKHG